MLTHPLFPDRLATRLPDFTRISWVNDELRAEWAPRIRKVSNAWNELEWLTAAQGFRKCALVTVSPDDLIGKSAQWVEYGLANLPFEIQGASGSYSATSVATKHGDPFFYRIAIGKPEDLRRFKIAVDKNDDPTIGELLGFPICCREFFKKVWVEESCIDTTWAMARNSLENVSGRDIEFSDVDPLRNILWRWAGLRTVWHLPCGINCEPTYNLAKSIVTFAEENGFQDEMGWLKEMLSWPVEWSGLHGIAEVKNPILKISTRTDSTANKYSVRFKSEHYPPNGITGLNFPYQKPARRKVTASVNFQRGIEHNISEEVSVRPQWYASDNGFSSTIAMEQSHEPIVNACSQLLACKSGTILDLGCGNGALLKRIWSCNEEYKIAGIDISEQCIIHANEYEPVHDSEFLVGNMFTETRNFMSGTPFDLTLLMPGRLLECSETEALELLDVLGNRTKMLIVYAYGDWLTRYNSLEGLVAQIPMLEIKNQVHNSCATASIQSS